MIRAGLWPRSAMSAKHHPLGVVADRGPQRRNRGSQLYL